MVTYGTPGAHAALLARQRNLRALALRAGGLAVMGAAAVAVAAGAPLAVVLVSAVVAGVAAAMAAPVARDARKAAAGARSERRVAAAIASARPVAVVHGAMVGAGGDADHVVCGPVLAVVETKTGTGRVQVGRSDVKVAGRLVPGDPVAQARRQAAAVRAAVGTWTVAVVCIVDMEGAPFEARGVWVCSAAALPAVLRRQRPVLGERAALAAAERLAAATGRSR